MTYAVTSPATDPATDSASTPATDPAPTPVVARTREELREARAALDDGPEVEAEVLRPVDHGHPPSADLSLEGILCPYCT